MNRRDYFIERLRQRATRLLKLIDMKAPDLVISGEVANIFRAGLGLDRSGLGDELLGWFAKRVLASSGFCSGSFCDGKGRIRPDRGFLPECEVCEKGREQDRAELDADEAACPECGAPPCGEHSTACPIGEDIPF